MPQHRLIAASPLTWSLDRRSLVLCFSLGLGGCPATHPPSEGCGKDTDCKDDRLCVDGVCVTPSDSSPAASSPSGDAREHTPEQPKPTAGQGRTWSRGGPGHAGASAAVGPKREPSLLWSVELGAVVFATPTLVRNGAVSSSGRVTEPTGTVAYVGTHGGHFVGIAVDGAQAGKIVLDLELGGRIWATAGAHGEGDALRLYVGNDDDTLFAIAPHAEESAGGNPDPRISWSKRLGNCENTRSPGPEGARCDVDGGPTIAPDGDLFVGADGVYRLAPDGEIRWHWPASEVEPRAKHVFSTPVLSDGHVYVGGQDGFITALAAETGEQQWQYAVQADVDGSGVIGSDGALFIGADDGRIYAIRSDGSLRWSFVAQRDIRSSLGIAPDGTVYATSFDGNLYSLAPSGEVNWVLPSGGVIHSSPVVDVDGYVFFGSQDDHLYAVSPVGRVEWAIDLGADVDSSVAIAETGALVIGCDDGTLRAYADTPRDPG
jgi:outer membrane protein assembly factor BamB